MTPEHEGEIRQEAAHLAAELRKHFETPAGGEFERSIRRALIQFGQFAYERGKVAAAREIGALVLPPRHKEGAL